MRILLAAALVVALAGGAVVEAAPPEGVVLSVWAAEATKQDRKDAHFDRGLEPIRRAVSDLPYNHYKRLNTGQLKAPMGSAESFALDSRYTLVVKPVSREPDKRLRMEVRVEMKPREKGKKPINALETRLRVRPGEMVKFHGLKTEGGEMVVVLSPVK